VGRIGERLGEPSCPDRLAPLLAGSVEGPAHQKSNDFFHAGELGQHFEQLAPPGPVERVARMGQNPQLVGDRQPHPRLSEIDRGNAHRGKDLAGP
jgi:hypothetical protein